jgi:hypothetical protein
VAFILPQRRESHPAPHTIIEAVTITVIGTQHAMPYAASMMAPAFYTAGMGGGNGGNRFHAFLRGMGSIVQRQISDSKHNR